MKLYELTDRQAVILSMLEDVDGGEIPDDLAAELDAIDSQIGGKVEAICKIIAGYEAEAEALTEEASRIRARADSCEMRASSLKKYIRECLERCGQAKVKTPLFTVWIQSSPPSVQWEGEAKDAPAEYQRVTVAVDRAKALEVHRAGGELPPGFTVTQGSYLRIK